MIEVEAERARGAGSEQLEDAPRAGAEIDEEREGPLPQRLVHGALDLLLGDMQRADSVPLGGMRLEIGLRRLGARLLHGSGPCPVAGEGEIRGIEARDDGAGERSLRPAFGEAEEDPGAFAEARDEASFGHQLQVAADARLALAEDLGQVLDVELGSGEQHEDAQARRLAGGTERREALCAR